MPQYTQAAEKKIRAVSVPVLDCGVPLFVCHPQTAELAQCQANTFLGLKISYINAIADMCEVVGTVHVPRTVATATVRNSQLATRTTCPLPSTAPISSSWPPNGPSTGRQPRRTLWTVLPALCSSTAAPPWTPSPSARRAGPFTRSDAQGSESRAPSGGAVRRQQPLEGGGGHTL
ncbi:hypothetical protein [Streptomyces sp. NPDC088258]|uniref:hypothetical protein n=1 Tax=Streptomyces sp. NPDC088258 TaxID=3365849 RepID=UPI0038136985